MKEKKNEGSGDTSGSITRIHSPAAGLVVEPEAGDEKDQFRAEVQSVLERTEAEVLGSVANKEDARMWQEARGLVERFQPVPWFIWRLSNYVFGTPGQINKISEGLVLGLRRLLFAAASDKVLGAGEKVNDMRRALRELPSDVVGAVAVIHAISRRLHSKEFERIWKPILDDAILRAQIGYYAGQLDASFGPGRGMLAGFAGRSGLAILISSGTLEQAREGLDELSKGSSISNVGRKIYSVDPLQVSAMTLGASGCGRDASFGTVAFASGAAASETVEGEQRKWLAAFTITEAVRTSNPDLVSEPLWEALNFKTQEDKDDLFALVKMMVRKGHGWNWLM